MPANPFFPLTRKAAARPPWAGSRPPACVPCALPASPPAGTARRTCCCSASTRCAATIWARRLRPAHLPAPGPARRQRHGLRRRHGPGALDAAVVRQRPDRPDARPARRLPARRRSNRNMDTQVPRTAAPDVVTLAAHLRPSGLPHGRLLRQPVLRLRPGRELRRAHLPQPARRRTWRVALDWVRRHADRPFFCFVLLNDPHEPTTPPRGGPRPVPARRPARVPARADLRALARWGGGARPHLGRAPWPLDEQAARGAGLKLAIYDATIRRVDRAIGGCRTACGDGAWRTPRWSPSSATTARSSSTTRLGRAPGTTTRGGFARHRPRPHAISRSCCTCPGWPGDPGVPAGVGVTRAGLAAATWRRPCWTGWVCRRCPRRDALPPGTDRRTWRAAPGRAGPWRRTCGARRRRRRRPVPLRLVWPRPSPTGRTWWRCGGARWKLIAAPRRPRRWPCSTSARTPASSDDRRPPPSPPWLDRPARGRWRTAWRAAACGRRRPRRACGRPGDGRCDRRTWQDLDATVRLAPDGSGRTPSDRSTASSSTVRARATNACARGAALARGRPARPASPPGADGRVDAGSPPAAAGRTASPRGAPPPVPKMSWRSPQPGQTK